MVGRTSRSHTAAQDRLMAVSERCVATTQSHVKTAHTHRHSTSALNT